MGNRKRILIGATMVVCLGAGWLSAQSARQGEETRTLEGKVVDASSAPVQGAVVQLKDTRTLQIRTYLTVDGGVYRFGGLSTNRDYEVRAEHQGMGSATKTLTTFDSRKTASIDLKLDKKL